MFFHLSWACSPNSDTVAKIHLVPRSRTHRCNRTQGGTLYLFFVLPETGSSSTHSPPRTGSKEHTFVVPFASIIEQSFLQTKKVTTITKKKQAKVAGLYHLSFKLFQKNSIQKEKIRLYCLRPKTIKLINSSHPG